MSKVDRKLKRVLRAIVVASLWVTAGAIALPALAQDLDGRPVVAVDRDPAKDGFSITSRVGVAPFNAYYLGVTASLALRLDFTRFFGWEVVDGTYVIPLNKDLTTQLADRYGVNPQRIEKSLWLATSHLSYRPLFGKLLLFGEFVREFDLYFLLGGGTMQTSERTVYGASYGVEVRGRITPSVALIAGVRSLYPFHPQTQHFTAFQTGLGLLF